MRVLGIDPSTTGGYYALLECKPGGTATLLEKGFVGGSRDELHASIKELFTQLKPELVAIETPEGTPVTNNGMALLNTAALAGYFEAVALGMDLKAFTVGAMLWRREMCSKSSPTNAEIHYYYRLLVQDSPKTNEHIRDAAMTGLHAIQKRFS